jgi:hypothetical protein
MAMRRYGLLVAVAAVSSSSLYGVAQVNMVRDRPFIAIKAVSTDLPRTQYTVAAKMARNSEGSTYYEIPDTRDNSLFMVVIQNVSRQQTIYLYPKDRQYTLQQTPFPTLAQLPDKSTQIELQKKQDEGLMPSKQTRDDGAVVETQPLGFRTENGFLEFGDRRTFSNLPPTSGLKERVWETWTILGEALTGEQIGFDENHQMRQQTKLTEIETKEPDPKLFEIPEGYTLRPPPPVRSKQ